MSNTPTTCPKCGAASKTENGFLFECQSNAIGGEGGLCVRRQRDQLLQKVQRLEEELESHAWKISPAMAQAKIDQLNEKVKRLEEDKDILTRANAQVRRIAMERDEAERRISELDSRADNLTNKATAWKMYADRLEEAGSKLRTAAAMFRLKEIEDNDGMSVPMEDMPKGAGILYDDLPTAGDHVALSEATHNWTKAKETKP